MFKKAWKHNAIIFSVQAVIALIVYRVTEDMVLALAFAVITAFAFVFVEELARSNPAIALAAMFAALALALVAASAAYAVGSAVIAALALASTAFAAEKYQKEEPTESFSALFTVLLPSGIGFTLGGIILMARTGFIKMR
ncbi:hypothetical protein MYX07_03245 [Patescibacteria group bacterium AH-259-L07]|nr:hypothetical protein [Patescibacteria group bacterium AH-259-L07]